MKGPEGRILKSASLLILSMTLACALAAPARSAGAPARPQTRAEYVKKAHAELDELSDKIDALELKAKALGTAAQAGLDDKIAALKARRKTEKKDLAKLKRASGKAWTDLKAGVDKGLAELKSAYDEAAKD